MNHLQALSEYKRLVNAMPPKQRKAVESMTRAMMKSGIRLRIWDLLAIVKDAMAKEMA